MKAVVLFVGLAGCGFQVAASSAGDDAPPNAPVADGPVVDDDAPPPRDIPHLPASHEQIGPASVMLVDGTMIDTTSLTITPAAAGLTIDMVAQEPGGPELMLLRAGAVTIPANAEVTVAGIRPLVILADTIVIAGVLDGGARLATPGPGGGSFAAPAPDGTGGDGEHRGSYADSGGGGGGLGTPGGLGGAGSTSCSLAAVSGPSGPTWNTELLELLRGGAAGGRGAAVVCTRGAPGAGGGAIQLSAFGSLAIEATGMITVGGGGGGAGVNCGGSDTGAGSGGGAGGALYLDAPVLRRDGELGANGGGGGGGGSSPGSTGVAGNDARGAAAVALGGAGGGSYGARGGNGATATVAATNGTNNTCDGNGGGGGGGVGRIVVRGETITGTGLASPMPIPAPFTP